MNDFVLYGATGYTGSLMARMAVEKGMKPLLSGRNEEKLKAVAEPLGLDYKAVDLSDQNGLNGLLRSTKVVLHCAGPFSATSAPMIRACLKTGTHYLDITGEIEVFEQLQDLSDAGKKVNIMIMPGVGFDVVPTDCMAAHMKKNLSDATELSLSIGGMKGVSPGTAKTALESIGKKTRARRQGKIVGIEPVLGNEDFGWGERKTIAASWGDVSTAYYTTGIPNITVFFEANKQLEKLMQLNGFTRWLLSRSFIQNKLKENIDRKVTGPSDEQREKSSGIIYAEARNEKGRRMKSMLRVPEGYTLTCHTALEITSRVLKGDFKTGFQTPARMYGPDFILQFEKVERKDL